MKKPNEVKTNEAGFTLLEAIASICLISILALNVTKSTVAAYQVFVRSEYNDYASQLALRKMEQWAAKNPSSLTAASGGTETGVTVDKVRFTRLSTIVVNADGSRTVTVKVTITKGGTSGNVTYTNNFALWGKS